ncbi:hypothetical protein COM40_25065 [Bacillus wiedmannii]|nr:hypothetical protein CN889_30440 [Bacillus wiedmannii]PEU22428.1 hypothetical protein CN532_27140 [Bacillus wiedmannii]PFZ26151.1 hypothetical protein COL51_16270 [Bacillus wiedmannii]PGC14509.1 hypothetical protein COM08_24795 [Bacillus wiedmannii]PGC51505.1 hypothetical protein COM22_26890 [Bacillus wiedmannii]
MVLPHRHQAKFLIYPLNKIFLFLQVISLKGQLIFLVNEICGGILLFRYAIRHFLFTLISSMIIYNLYIFILNKEWE